jgi:translocator protein
LNNAVVSLQKSTINLNRFTQIAITWVAFAAMFAINALANTLPINGLNTGDVSALYPNFFVPDGFTFSIWSIIYLWLIVFAGYATNVLIWLPKIDQRHQRIVSILPLFWITCLLNASWIIAWHYLYIWVSLFIMLLFLGTLILLFNRLNKHRAHPRKRDHMLVEVPFIIYLGWISVATIANTTALLVSLGYSGAPLGEATWSMVLIMIATGLGIWMAVINHRPAYTLVICWALWGIYRSQHMENPTIGAMALGCMAIGIGFSLRELLRPKAGYLPA